MAHISAGVEYGLHCLLFLIDANGDARQVSARDLADLQGIPKEFIAKVFTRLQKAGLVTAAEGAGGGFRLARDPATISVLDVVMAIDGEKELFDCREIRERCPLFDAKPQVPANREVCSIHAIMLEAQARMRAALAAHTLAEIAATVASKLPAHFDDQVTAWLSGRSR